MKSVSAAGTAVPMWAVILSTRDFVDAVSSTSTVVESSVILPKVRQLLPYLLLVALMTGIVVDAANRDTTTWLNLLVVIAIIGFTATVAVSRFMEQRR